MSQRIAAHEFKMLYVPRIIPSNIFMNIAINFCLFVGNLTFLNTYNIS